MSMKKYINIGPAVVCKGLARRSSWEVSEEIQERLSCVNVETQNEDEADFWVANIKYDSAMAGEIDDVLDAGHGFAVIEGIAEEVGNFTNFFEPEIAVLRRHYKSVKISYGVTGHWM